MDNQVNEVVDMTLYSSQDEGRINPAQVVIRRDVLEVRLDGSGRVSFQCACCGHLPRDERTEMSTLAPQRLEALPRAVSRFMTDHVRACKHVPRDIKALSRANSRRAGDVRAKKYWIESAKKKGLRNGEGGIVIFNVSDEN